MPHSSFFPTPETIFTSDDVFFVAQPTSGIVTTITSSTRHPPLMHSTPISSHTSPSYVPSPPGLTHEPMPTLDLAPSGVDSQPSARIPIYTPGHESSSSSSFSGFSDTLVNRARAIASPRPTTPRSNVTPLFDVYNTPTYSSHPNAKPYYIRPPPSASPYCIPRPTTPTQITLPYMTINLPTTLLSQGIPLYRPSTTPVIHTTDLAAFIRNHTVPTTGFRNTNTPTTPSTVTITTSASSNRRDTRLQPKRSRTTFFSSKPWK